MRSKKIVQQKGELEKPKFGSIYRTTGSKYLYISFYYFNQRLRLPTDREDTPGNREELSQFMNKIGKKIRLRTFQFAKTFYWLDEETKEHFTTLEGREYKPEPEHVLFGEYALEWMEKNIPRFSSLTKQRDYRQVILSRIIPYFEEMTFAQITATEVHMFIDTMARCDRTKAQVKNRQPDKPLSVKRIKNVIGPLTKIWTAACNHYNWDLRDPFTGIGAKYAELSDRLVQQKEQDAVLKFLCHAEDEVDTREVLLLKEWQKVLSCMDPHYHVVMDLLLAGLIGSELEGLMKQHIQGDMIQIRCSLVRDGGSKYLKFKPKNWFRKRDIPLTMRMRQLLDGAAAKATCEDVVEFDNDITIPASQFVLTMLDGSPFNYDSFRKTVWNKALRQAGLPPKVPYSARHTLVQWALLIGVTKTRLVDLMGHSTKKMIDEVYGKYRQGLVEEREQILDYLGEDYLALEELRTYFPERYRRRMAMEEAV